MSEGCNIEYARVGLAGGEPRNERTNERVVHVPMITSQLGEGKFAPAQVMRAPLRVRDSRDMVMSRGLGISATILSFCIAWIVRRLLTVVG